MGKMNRAILRLTDGLLGTGVNGVLWWFYVMGASIGKSKTSYGVFQTFQEADEALREMNYESFKQIVSNLKRLGFIKKTTRYSQTELLITEEGKKRIESFIPKYQTNRPWDGYCYLISYDIPEAKHVLRNVLRRYLKKMGCALIQESLWVTPYNPRKLLDEFMDEHGIFGTVLVSKLGHDGAIGTETLSNFIERVYNLHAINQLYREFIENTKDRKYSKMFTIRVFQRIIKDDPQLPFKLLPSWWLGDHAYAQYMKIVQGV